MDIVLIFIENIGKFCYVEIWDFYVLVFIFLQFEMSMGCSKFFSSFYSVQFQYFLNNGKDWYFVIEECVFLIIGCLYYMESLIYILERFQNWKWIIVYFLFFIIFFRIWFRWIQVNYIVGVDFWVIDNVVLVLGCFWMCLG